MIHIIYRSPGIRASDIIVISYYRSIVHIPHIVHAGEVVAYRAIETTIDVNVSVHECIVNVVIVAAETVVVWIGIPTVPKKPT